MSVDASSFPQRPLDWHRRVLVLAIPIILANLTQPILAAVDTGMAGHLSDPAALGGVALGGVLFNFIFWGFGFLRMGTSALVAQAHGAGDRGGLGEVQWRAMLLALVIGLVVLALQGPLISGGLALLGGSEAVAAQGMAYAGARIWSAPLALGNYVILGSLLGRQQVRAALVLQAWINLVNIAVVVLLVETLGWGVIGIGASTAIADASGFALGAWMLHSLGGAGARPHWRRVLAPEALLRLMRINRDLFLRTVALLGCFAGFARLGAGQGDMILAANALLLNFQSFMAFALDGFAHAAEALTGAAIGARRHDALRAAVRTGLIWSMIGAGAFALVYAVAGGQIIALLTDQADLREVAGRFLPWVILLPLVSAPGFLFDGVFIGATWTGALMRAMLICAALFAVLAPALRAVWGNHGLWLALLVFMAARGATLAMGWSRRLRDTPQAA